MSHAKDGKDSFPARLIYAVSMFSFQNPGWFLHWVCSFALQPCSIPTKNLSLKPTAMT